ncbi:hypothetical protein [Ktedonobacter racemifer]|uniref:Uncharacterized protein n=1 Tax=Ktedonobacter racemifer DSM 44963 TaxID=485913 RepID=D6TVG3_KTERA|nr:hypothetical protein [Ktedonobacter racemifer]EFH85366.1 hypothetical protein Krac_6576 [Ktedonobacter racemifer DSM 44963]
MSDQPVIDPTLPNMERVVFTTSRKRWVIPGLFVGGMLALLAISIFLGLLGKPIGILFLLGQPFTLPNLILILFALVCWVGVAVLILCIVVSFVIKMKKFMKPLRLQIDASGLTASLGREHQYQIQWPQIEEIRIIRPPSPFAPDELWLAVWTRPGVADPKKEMFPSEWRPEWRMDIGGVKVCEVNHFSRPAVEIGNAVARFAGKLWCESQEPR